MAHYDLVLTDIKMPNMDGLEFLHRVRTELENTTLPIIIISTKGEEEDVARGMALGATAYLTKPVSAPKLLETIGRILGQSDSSH
jgi:CheY-like chemotaxis protein